jgi:nucleoside-diphosphate-sugar epimerase
MKILVTGASGFIGGRIVEILAQNPEFIILATGRSSTEKFGSFSNVIYSQQDLIHKMPQISCEICIHCAGLADDTSTRAQLTENNVIATENLLESLQNCKVFIFISSSSVYDFSDGKPKSESDVDISSHKSLYGQSKFQAEKLVANSGIESIYILRPRAVYGSGDRILLPRILQLIKNGIMIIPGQLSNETSLTHVDNLCEVVSKSILQSKSGVHIYNVADKRVYDLNSIFSAILLQKTSKKSMIEIPTSIVKIIININRLLGIRGRLNQQSLSYISQPSILSIEKVETELGYAGAHDFYGCIGQLGISSKTPSAAETDRDFKYH